jgi:hypothetical protein
MFVRNVGELLQDWCHFQEFSIAFIVIVMKLHIQQNSNEDYYLLGSDAV